MGFLSAAPGEWRVSDIERVTDAILRALEQEGRDTLGEKAKPYSLHGLRKLAIVQLAEAGASDAEIQAVTGQSPAIIAYYRSQANKRHLSRVAQNRREKE